MIYNDFDRHACAWLRELIKAGHLPEGTVDERSIKDVRGDDIRDARQWHTFAGIGGWPYALRLAGWPESIRTWTGSCPCQPYSAAGKGKGDADERNLWPDFYRLIRECCPDVVFGEQVENAVGHGWLDGVFADLEREGYACGAAVLGAHSVGAPHKRQRLYWVAYTSQSGTRPDKRGLRGMPGGCGEVGGMADARPSSPRNVSGPVGESATERKQEATEFAGRGAIGGVAITIGERRRGGDAWGENASDARFSSEVGAWDRFDLLPCRDGKARRTQPGLFPLAHGVPGRVGLLRGYGNAIVPQVAAAFITAFMQSVGIQREGTRHG